MDGAIGSLTTPPAALRPAGDVAVRVEASSSPQAAHHRSAWGSTSEFESDPNARSSARREVNEDTATGSMVYRLVDVATGDVTSLTPSEARLKLRAYIDRVVSQKTSQPSFEATA